MEFENYNDEVPFKVNDYLDEKARKKRIKEEKKRRKSYKFSDKEHSKRGILSCIFALLALIFVVIAIILSTNMRGMGDITVGALTIAGFAATIFGFIIAALSFRETDSLMRFPWIGIISNGIIFLILATIVISGL